MMRGAVRPAGFEPATLGCGGPTLKSDYTWPLRIVADELSAIYFVPPRVMLAVSPRVAGARPVPQMPQLLWSADTLAASGPRR